MLLCRRAYRRPNMYKHGAQPQLFLANRPHSLPIESYADKEWRMRALLSLSGPCACRRQCRRIHPALALPAIKVGQSAPCASPPPHRLSFLAFLSSNATYTLASRYIKAGPCDRYPGGPLSLISSHVHLDILPSATPPITLYHSHPRI